MFFRILVLLPLVSLIMANPLLGRGNVVDVCDAINNMNMTITDMEIACKTFQLTPNNAMAQVRLPIQLESPAFFLTPWSQAIITIGYTLDYRITYTTNVCPVCYSPHRQNMSLV